MIIDRTSALVSALALTLGSGCASAGPETDSHLRSAYERAMPPARERDDHVLEGPLLDRAAFVRAVLDRNPSLEAARQGWRGAIAHVRGTGAFEDPMVDVGVAPLSIGSSEARFGLEARVSQKLPWFGKRAFERAIAAAEADGMRSDFEAARRDLALAASLLHDDYYLVARTIEITAHHVELLRALAALATAQMETGRSSLQDALAAEAEITHMEHDAVVLDVNRSVAVAQMNELLHRDPRLPLPPPPRELSPPAQEASMNKKDDAIERRPEINAARARVRAEEARALHAERASWPDVSVSTSYNTMWDMPQHRWMVGLGLNVPLQTGARAAAVEEAQAARARHESTVLQLTDAARTEIAIAQMRLEESAHVVRLFDTRLLPVARDQIAAARAAFIASQAPFGAVIEAERNLRHVELESETARVEQEKRRAQLERALGATR